MNLINYNKAYSLLAYLDIPVDESILSDEEIIAVCEDIMLGNDNADVKEIVEGCTAYSIEEYSAAVKKFFVAEDFAIDVKVVDVSERARPPKLRGIKKKMRDNKSKVMSAANKDEKFRRLKEQFKKKAKMLLKQLAKKEGIQPNKIDFSKIKI